MVEFLGPAGFGSPDDGAALEACQRGYHMDSAVWNDISGGMLDGADPGDSELTLRVFWSQWDKVMRGDASVTY
ncbi:MAG: hypothetical protein AB7O04_00240 [Hyphomonadaceae bacterium]